MEFSRYARIKPYIISSVLNLLSNGLKILGYKPEHKDFSTIIDKQDHRLKVYYSPPDSFPRLLVLHSYKPDVNLLTKRMTSFGFETIFLEEYKNIHTCAALYTKT